MVVRFSGDTMKLTVCSDFVSYLSYLFLVVHFSSWFSTNFLHLNVSKTKEMCIDVCCNKTVISPIVNLSGEYVEQVDSFQVPWCCVRKNCHLQSVLQLFKKRSLNSDCTFFESCELSTLTQNFYVSTVASLSLS
jgi:hypothetical protein